MPILAICGDIHGDIDGMYKHFFRLQEHTNATISGILHVGDFGCYLREGAAWSSPFMNTAFQQYWDGVKKIPIPTWVCPGNHEDYTVLKMWLAEPYKIPNLHLLRDGHVQDVLGVRVGSVWGNFSYKSWLNPLRVLVARTTNFSEKIAVHIYKPAVDLLKRAGEFDILITHDAPAGLMKPMRQPPAVIKHVLGLEPDEPASGCPGFNEIYDTSKCKYHFFGHFHSRWVCQERNPRVTCLGCFNYDPPSSIEIIEF